MRITNVDSWTVAVPFRNPIRSAYGVSYPARIRTLIRLTTDDGYFGIGETGPSAVVLVDRDELSRRVSREIAPVILGRDPFAIEDTLRALQYAPDAVAIELACLDIIGKVVDRPVSELLGGVARPVELDVAAYCFFRMPDQSGQGGVTPDNYVAAVVEQVERSGFRTVKLKFGVYSPEVELECLRAVREALPSHKLRIDPNGSWSLATATRQLRHLEDLDLEYVEDPTRDSPMGYQQGVIPGKSIDVSSMRRLRSSSTVPICADICYRKDLLREVIRGEAADVVLADVFGCGGIRGTLDWYRTADMFHLGLGMHSGAELGVGQAAKMHAVAAMGGRVLHAMDALYPEYVDDVIVGGPFPIADGCIAFPNSPGLGIDLDEHRLAQYELTRERHAELDAWWAHCKREAGSATASSSMLTQEF